jgi:hypothetical protein
MEHDDKCWAAMYHQRRAAVLYKMAIGHRTSRFLRAIYKPELLATCEDGAKMHAAFARAIMGIDE